ncbi:hypothetical protein ID866_12628, partial [Astraeus odoratus]
MRCFGQHYCLNTRRMNTRKEQNKVLSQEKKLMLINRQSYGMTSLKK